MVPDELSDVAVKVLPRHLVVGSDMPAAKHRPERLHAVRMGHASDILTGTVIDRLVATAHSPVGGSIVRVDHGFEFGVWTCPAGLSFSSRNSEYWCCQRPCNTSTSP